MTSYHHISYYSFPYRWITGVWGCCATSFLLANHRLRPKVHMKHTVEYPRSAAALWCVHGSLKPSLFVLSLEQKAWVRGCVYRPVLTTPMARPNQGTRLYTCRILVLCTTRGSLSLVPRPLPSFLSLAVRLSILKAMRSWARPWERGYSNFVPGVCCLQLCRLALFVVHIQVDLHFPSHVSLEARDLISKVSVPV